MSDLPAAHDTQAAFAAVLVDEWVRAGVRDAVVAPGSRSTPLLIALAERAEAGDLRLYVVLDERSAGFIAIGLGRGGGAGGAGGRPALVVTTSGTAAVELHPAIVEADQVGAPLIAVTADRPPELHDCGAPQTVPQVGLFGSAPRWQASPGIPDLGAAPSWRSMASRAVAEAMGRGRRPGPVHLNLAFREPLLGTAPPGVLAGGAGSGDLPGAGPPLNSALTGELPAAGPSLRSGAGEPAAGLSLSSAAGELPTAGPRPGGAPWHWVPAVPEVRPAPEVVDFLAGFRRGLIVAGLGAGDSSAVWALAEASGWPVLAEPTSGCRGPRAIAAADALLRIPVVRDWAPDVVLRLGAPWLSRVLNHWLSELPCPQVLVDEWGTWAAPDRRPGLVVRCSPGPLCRALAEAHFGARAVGTSGDGWGRRWSEAERLAQEAIDTALGREGRATEPAVARRLVRWAPDGVALVVSSSMPVRDVEWWSEGRDGVRVIANRGANGIDGVLSTAIGVSLAGNQRVVALLGDLAFVYDITALLPARELGARLDVVVVDNDGGGIFNFLAQAGQPRRRFELLWGTPHGLSLSDAAQGLGVEAGEAADIDELVNRLESRVGEGGVSVHIVRTSRGDNVAVHQRLHAAVSDAVAGLG